jgi:hypothetical protein
MALPLSVVLPGNAQYRELVLGDNTLNPRTWKVRGAQGKEFLLAGEHAIAFFQETEKACNVKVELIYISVSHDEDGRHRFVNLGAARAALHESGDQLPVLSEGEVKSMRAQEPSVELLYAQKRASSSLPVRDSRPSVAIPLQDELCPHASLWAKNYTVIAELSHGLTQRLILCDEATLCRVLPEEGIFDHLRLIVNCHESSVLDGKYKIGNCSSAEKPTVICQEVHKWHSLGAANMNKVNDEIQTSIWDALQKGTVAVHCLAGIHRAACIVACHFLWRRHVLGHTDIPGDANTIYAKLKAVRPAVSPAYTHVLQNYEKYLLSRRGSAGAKS